GGEWEIEAARRPKPVEAENASIIARLLQHDARPGANSEVEECFTCVAKRESRDVGRGDDAEPGLLELARQGESPLRPPRGIGRIVLGPSVNPDRGFAPHNVDTISLDRSSKFCQGLLEPRLGLGRRAINQARGPLRDQMLERRPLSQRDRSGSEPSSEIDERESKQNGRRIEEQAK